MAVVVVHTFSYVDPTDIKFQSRKLYRMEINAETITLRQGIDYVQNQSVSHEDPYIGILDVRIPNNGAYDDPFDAIIVNTAVKSGIKEFESPSEFTLTGLLQGNFIHAEDFSPLTLILQGKVPEYLHSDSHTIVDATFMPDNSKLNVASSSAPSSYDIVSYEPSYEYVFNHRQSTLDLTAIKVDSSVTMIGTHEDPAPFELTRLVKFDTMMEPETKPMYLTRIDSSVRRVDEFSPMTLLMPKPEFIFSRSAEAVQ